MIRKLLHGLLVATILWPIAASAQVLTNPNGVTLTPATFQTANLQAAATTCANLGACLQVHLPINANGAAITLAGTFSATAQFEESGDNQITWPTNVGSSSAVGLTTVSFTGITDIRVRLSAYTSGTVTATINVTLNTGLAGPPGPAGGTSSPSSLTYYFNNQNGLSPTDSPFNAKGDIRWCYDGQSTGGTNFTSVFTGSITNTAVSAGTATITAGNHLQPGSIVSIAGSTNGGGIFNVTNVNVLAASGTAFTFALVGTVGSAADTGTYTSNCAGFTAADIGKHIGISGAGAAGATFLGSISNVVGGVVTLNSPITPGSLSNVKFWWGTDDTNAVQSWCNAIQNGSVNANGSINPLRTAHSGYLGNHFYYMTKPCMLVNPIGASGFSPSSFGTTEPFNLSNANEAVSIVGTGSLSSGFVVDGNFNFNGYCTAQPALGVGSNLVGVVGSRWWNGSLFQNFAIVGDESAFMTSASCTLTPAGFASDTNGHELITNIQVTGIAGTNANPILGMILASPFEDIVSNNTLFANQGNFQVNAPANTWMYNNRFEGWTAQTTTVFNVTIAGAATNSGFVGNRIIDETTCNIGTGCAGPAGGSEVVFTNTFSIPGSNTGSTTDFVWEGNEVNSILANSLGTVFQASATGVVSGTGNTFANTNAVPGASTQLIVNAAAAITLNLFGGSISCRAACANGISNASGSFINEYNVKESASMGHVGTGANAVIQLNQTSTPPGVGGLGAISTTGIGNLLTATVTGTGACATVTGSPSLGTFTCTGATAASTFTLTFTTTAPHGWVCNAYDQTTTANAPRQTGNSPTTCVVTVASVTANDVIVWNASFF